MQTRSQLNCLSVIRKSRGFSMLELMITIALVGILVALAVPSFELISNINKLSGTSNELLTSLQIARTEAIRRGVHVVVCKSANADSGVAATCSTTAGNWDGWIAFVDDGGGTPANARNGARNANETVLRVGRNVPSVLMVPSAAISGSTPAQVVSFRPDGLARTSSNALLTGQIRVCIITSAPLQNTRAVALASGSRTSITKVTDANCTTTTN